MDVATRDVVITKDNHQQAISALKGVSAAIPKEWSTYAILRVPASFLSIMGLANMINVDENLVREEVLI